MQSSHHFRYANGLAADAGRQVYEYGETVKGNKIRLPSTGDTFVFRLGNGMYGCCRVLRFVEKGVNDEWSCDAVLVACCDWIGDSVPKN